VKEMPLAEKLNNQQLHEFKKIQEDDFEGYFEAGEPRPLIPEGIYKARFIEIQKGQWNGTPKIYLWFQIIEPYEYEGVKIRMLMNAYRKPSNGSNYYKAWVIANGSKPARIDRMSPDIFKGRIFEVFVETVKPKNKAGFYEPESLHYSKIACLIKYIE
jgi:hypothetical protein